MLQLVKDAGIQIAKTIAVQHIVEWAADEVRDNLLDGLEERVAGALSKIAFTALERNSILLSPNCNIEREQILREVQNEVFKATKTHKHTRVINELASGIFKASSNHSGMGKVLYAAHKVGSVVDISSKIEGSISIYDF